MILDQHHVSQRKLRIQPTAGIGYDQLLDPQRVKHADRQRDLLERVSFVEMKNGPA